MIINTNQPCEIGERMDTLRDVFTDERPQVVMIVIGVASRVEWDACWPDDGPSFPHGYFYRVSAD